MSTLSSKSCFELVYLHLFNKAAEKTTPSATFEVEPIIDFFSE